MPEYIEREALLGKVRERDLCLCVTEWDIKDAPAADVAPVVHGQWVWKQFPIPWGDSDLDVYTVCSVCGCCSPGESNYCPNCGAKMDIEE